MSTNHPDPAKAAIAEAESVVRGAADGIEELCDALALPMRLAAEQCGLAAQAAHNALSDLYRAAEAFAELQSAAWRALAAAGLTERTGLDSAAEADGTVVLRTATYTKQNPSDVVVRAAVYALNESSPRLPAGSRFELRIHRHGEDGI